MLCRPSPPAGCPAQLPCRCHCNAQGAFTGLAVRARAADGVSSLFAHASSLLEHTTRET